MKNKSNSSKRFYSTSVYSRSKKDKQTIRFTKKNMTNIYYDYELLQNYRVFVNKLSDIIKSGNKEGFEL